MSLADLTRTDALTAAPDTPLADLAAAMDAQAADVVVVLDEHRPRGLVTAGAVGRAYGGGRAADATALDVAADVPALRETTSRADLIAEFAAADAQALLVVDEADAYVGIVTREDLLATYGRELTAILDLFDRA